MTLALPIGWARHAGATPLVSPTDPALGPQPVLVDFETAAAGIYPAYAGGLSVPTSAGPVQFTAPRLAVTGTYAGQYNTRGSQYLSSEGYLFRNLVITFPTPVRAFGFHLGLTDQPWEILAYDASGTLLETGSIPATLGSNAGDFFGISAEAGIAQAILVVQLPLQRGPYWVVVDDLVFSAPTGVGLSVEKLGEGAIASTPAGIDCGAVCAGQFPSGTVVALEAAPAAGWFFGGWSGDCAGPDVATSIVLDGPRRCSATFHLASEGADLAAHVERAPSSIRAGQRLSYRIAAENRGPATAAAATLTLRIAGNGADVASVRAPRGCVVAGPVITCPLGDLSPDRKARTTIAATAAGAGLLTATVTASSPTPDPNRANASAEVVTVVR